MTPFRTLFLLGAASAIFGCTGPASPKPAMFPSPEHEGDVVANKAPAAPNADAGTEEYAVPKPPFSEGVFPCSECHAGMEPDLTRRELGMHDTIQLEHGPRERWCFDCHNPTDRDQLRLASGSLVPFSESYRLCGQCHGDKYRDWRVGVHGKRTGSWSGKKQYLLCANCHDPHSPRFKPIAPMPPPTAPGLLKRKAGVTP
ncbi:MAG: cytochrome c3 family protein [Myxococcaceae bacterium]